jgi:hypothetical protein
VLFGLLSLFDLLLTAWLLTRPEQVVYEANPVASRVLHLWGWPGVIALKLGCVLLACGVGVYLYRRRPRAGFGVFTFGCAITGAVVLYSGCLAAALDNTSVEQQRSREEGVEIDLKIAQLREYNECLNQIAAELNTGQVSLSEGIARLSATAWGRNPIWASMLRRGYGIDSERECLAINLVVQTGCQLAERGLEPCAATRRLTDEYRALFGHPMPPIETARKPAPYPTAPPEWSPQG